MKLKKWSIWRANLDPVVGSEQGKSRPVIIISENDINNFLMPLISFQSLQGSPEEKYIQMRF